MTQEFAHFNQLSGDANVAGPEQNRTETEISFSCEKPTLFSLIKFIIDSRDGLMSSVLLLDILNILHVLIPVCLHYLLSPIKLRVLFPPRNKTALYITFVIKALISF